MFQIPCVIFAGGKSSRMKEDKSLLPFADSTTLTHYQLQKLSKLFDTVYISCKDSSKFDFEASFILDNPKHITYAPTSGFLAIFDFLKEDTFFAISVDTPFISKEVIQKLIDADSSLFNSTIATLNSKVQPLCGIYHRSLYPEFIKMQESNNHKLGYLLKQTNTNYIDFSDETIFSNLNLPQDYAQALKLL